MLISTGFAFRVLPCSMLLGVLMHANLLIPPGRAPRANSSLASAPQHARTALSVSALSMLAIPNLIFSLSLGKYSQSIGQPLCADWFAPRLASIPDNVSLKRQRARDLRRPKRHRHLHAMVRVAVPLSDELLQIGFTQ